MVILESYQKFAHPGLATHFQTGFSHDLVLPNGRCLEEPTLTHFPFRFYRRQRYILAYARSLASIGLLEEIPALSLLDARSTSRTRKVLREAFQVRGAQDLAGCRYS